jgi:hypothetical protein
MGIIRLSDEEVFGTDSSEYEILYSGAKSIVGVPGAVVEIGTRRGGSAKMIIDALSEVGDVRRSMFCIDPYGNIEIECTNKNITAHVPGVATEGDPESTEITKPLRFDYTNEMRNRVIPSLYYYAYARGLNFHFFCLEDKEFFNRFSDGVPTYNDEKIMENEYAFVFFDGPHDNATLDLETLFFVSRAPVGAVFVFDDIWMYDHDKYEKQLFAAGFQILEKGTVKASYKRVER